MLAKPAADSVFCRKPIEIFADSFVCPVVLVGPDDAGHYRLNSSASLLADQLDLPAERWQRIETA